MNYIAHCKTEGNRTIRPYFFKRESLGRASEKRDPSSYSNEVLSAALSERPSANPAYALADRFVSIRQNGNGFEDDGTDDSAFLLALLEHLEIDPGKPLPPQVELQYPIAVGDVLTLDVDLFHPYIHIATQMATVQRLDPFWHYTVALCMYINVANNCRKSQWARTLRNRNPSLIGKPVRFSNRALRAWINMPTGPTN